MKRGERVRELETFHDWFCWVSYILSYRDNVLSKAESKEEFMRLLEESRKQFDDSEDKTEM